jgi:hypothetical protein
LKLIVPPGARFEGIMAEKSMDVNVIINNINVLTLNNDNFMREMEQLCG